MMNPEVEKHGGIGAGGWLHPRCRLLPRGKMGPIVAMPDARLATVDGEGFRSSEDEGHTWSRARPVCAGINTSHLGLFQMLCTRGGAIVIVYLDWRTYAFGWDEDAGEPERDCRLELWAIRSPDGGRTWVDRQRLLDGYNASFSGFVQTRTGRLVATVEHLVRDPGRWVVCSLVSDDEGRSWRRGNLVDLGGHGDHDGALEPTVAELSDGRLLMLMRTNLDRFWQALSEDGGRYWRTIQPSRLDASSSPGYLLRLRSGRLVLVWNRLHAESGTVHRERAGRRWEVPTSVYRDELSIAFSTDDAQSWTPPVVIVRQAALSYPYVFERRAGELWMAAMVRSKDPPEPLRWTLQEEEFLGSTPEAGGE